MLKSEAEPGRRSLSSYYSCLSKSPELADYPVVYLSKTYHSEAGTELNLT